MFHLWGVGQGVFGVGRGMDRVYIICEVKDAVCFTCEVWDRVRLV